MNNPPLAQDKAANGTAFLIIDMISDWQGQDMQALLRAAKDITPCLSALKARCNEAGVPVIYVNDNLGRWRSDFKTLVQTALNQGGDAAYIAEQLKPDHNDYFVLKPKQSAFFLTPLDLLLEHLGADRLIIGGVSADQCVLMTANDGLMRDYEVTVVKDGITSPSSQRTSMAHHHFDEVMKTTLLPSAEIQASLRT